MARKEERFLGDKRGEDVWHFSESARNEIRDFFSNKSLEIDEETEQKRAQIAREIFGHEVVGEPTPLVDSFVRAIEREALWAKRELDHLLCEGKKGEISSKLKKLLDRAKYLKKSFDSLSPELALQFPVDMEPLDHADYLEGLCSNIEIALAKTKAMTKKDPQARRHAIAVELIIRIFRTIGTFPIEKDDNIKLTATAHSKDYWFSDAVKLMYCIGNDLGLGIKETTWRDKILAAQKAAPDLKYEKQ